MRKTQQKQTIAIDFDDTLCAYVKLAIELVNQKNNWSFSYEAINDWHFSSFPENVRQAIYYEFTQPKIYDRQTPYPGAEAMLQTLIDDGHDVLITSSVYPELMSVRARQIMQMFPMVPPENILLGNRKDTVHVDIMLDDARHNIERTRAKYPVLLRRPWNYSMTGLLSVNNYDDFLGLVQRIAMTNAPAPQHRDNEPYILCLVGPSGAGKTAIMRELLHNPAFGAPKSTTTRKPRCNEPKDAYHFVSKDIFDNLHKEKAFLETTVYAGHRYGTQSHEITRIWESGRHAVIPIDICGATTIKSLYGNRAILVFVRRDRKDILSDIVARKVSDDDKVQRILSIESEFANEDLCDFTVKNNSSLRDAAVRITNFLQSA